MRDAIKPKEQTYHITVLGTHKPKKLNGKPKFSYHITLQHDGKTHRLSYTSTLTLEDIEKFCEWAGERETVHFMHDAHRELMEGLEKCKRQTRNELPTISGYAISQWLRFIYGHKFTNHHGPLMAKLYTSMHPETTKLLNFRS